MGTSHRWKGKINTVEETDSEDEADTRNFKSNSAKVSSFPYPAVVHEIDGPSISQNQIIHIAPGEGNIPVSFSSESDWETLAFPKEYATGKIVLLKEEVSP